MNELSPKDQEALVRRHVHQLLEHYDVVQILVSGTNAQGHTENVFIGGGNWYARQGMAHEFIMQDRSRSLADRLKDVIAPDPPEDGEEWKAT